MFKRMCRGLLAAALFAGAGAVHAFIPQAGIWAMPQELNGKPGRGLVIDVQNGVLSMQMYAYEQTGRPTFYLAVGNLVDNRITTEFKHYEGGRYFGSGERTGVEKGSAGLVTVRFVDGMNGFITFPGEAEKPISRFNFGYAPIPESLKGAWFFNKYSPTMGWQVDVPVLATVLPATANGSGVVLSSDRLFACEHIVRGELAGLVVCAKYLSAGSSTVQHIYAFKYSVHDGEGDWYPNSGPTAYGLYMRRVGTDQQLTGLIRKASEVSLSAETQAGIVESMNQAVSFLLKHQP